MSRRGIAAVVVLWALLLLGTLAMSFAFSMRTEAQASRNGLEAARAYFQARTGVDRAIALLSSLPADNVLAGPGGRGGDGGAAVVGGEPVKPRNGRLAGVGELGYVRGVTPEFFTRFLAVVFTVDSGTPGVNMNVAPLEGLRVLPGLTPELAAPAGARR